MESEPFSSGFAGNGYWTLWVTHSRFFASNAMFIGLAMSGSAATSSTTKPVGT